MDIPCFRIQILHTWDLHATSSGPYPCCYFLLLLLLFSKHSLSYSCYDTEMCYFCSILQAIIELVILQLSEHNRYFGWRYQMYSDNKNQSLFLSQARPLSDFLTQKGQLRKYRLTSTLLATVTVQLY